MKTKKQKKLKLYVWEDVLTDYSSGIIFAYAYSEDRARKLVLKKSGESNTVKNDISGKPLVVTKSSAFLVWGGG
jgi:hypothetical protein